MKLNVQFQELQSFPIVFNEPETFLVDFGDLTVIHTGDYYMGDYEVTPHVYQQILPTNQKLMSDNVLVYGIPIQKVSNPKGGNTATIG